MMMYEPQWANSEFLHEASYIFSSVHLFASWQALSNMCQQFCLNLVVLGTRAYFEKTNYRFILLHILCFLRISEPSDSLMLLSQLWKKKIHLDS